MFLCAKMSLRLVLHLAKICILRFTFRTLFFFVMVLYAITLFCSVAFERTALSFRAIVKENVQLYPTKNKTKTSSVEKLSEV